MRFLPLDTCPAMARNDSPSARRVRQRTSSWRVILLGPLVPVLRGTSAAAPPLRNEARKRHNVRLTPRNVEPLSCLVPQRRSVYGGSSQDGSQGTKQDDAPTGSPLPDSAC